MAVFVAPGDATPATGDGAPAIPPELQEAMVHAVAAAEGAGLTSYRVEISPDGTVTIIVCDPAEHAPPDPYGNLLG